MVTNLLPSRRVRHFSKASTSAKNARISGVRTPLISDQNDGTVGRKGTTSYHLLRDLKFVSVVSHLSKLFTQITSEFSRLTETRLNRAIFHYSRRICACPLPHGIRRNGEANRIGQPVERSADSVDAR